MQFSSISPFDWTQSGSTTPTHSESESDCNEGVLRIPQSSSIVGTAPTECLESYHGHSLGWSVTPLQRSSFVQKEEKIHVLLYSIVVCLHFLV